MYKVIKRIFSKTRDKSVVAEAVKKNWIDEQEYKEITGEEYIPTIEDAKTAKLAEIKKDCEAYINAGSDVTYADGSVEHFTYTLADQSNISEMFTAIVAGATEFPYHADGKICKIYSKEQIVIVYMSLSMFKAEATTRHNSLKAQINAMTDIEAVKAVSFDKTELTGEFLDNYNGMMASAKTQLEAIVANFPTNAE